MVHVVVLGAGLGGVIMAYEVKDQLAKADKVTVINKGSRYSFVPSNPWVAVGWRGREALEVDLAPVFARRDIDLKPQGAKRVHPTENRVELMAGSARAHPIHLPYRSRARRQVGIRPAGGQSRPCYHRSGAGRILLRTGL